MKKKTLLALPALVGAALSVAACSKPDDAANALTTNDVVLNDESADDNLVGGTDLSADNLQTDSAANLTAVDPNVGNAH